MTRSFITNLQTKLELSDVRDVVVTPIEEDDDGFVREIRVIGETSGQDVTDVILTVRIRSTTKADLDFTTPPLNY